MVLPKGKLGLSDLERLVFRHLPRIEGPRAIPLDYTAASISGCLVAATDPVIGVPLDYYGFFAVHYTAADVSMAGAIPHFLTLDVCYPPGTSEKWLKDTMRQLGSSARALNIQILGGHTGGYDGLTIPIISSTCLGVLPEHAQAPRPVKPKDILIAAGPVGRETLWFLANIEPEKIDEILSSRKRKQVAKDLRPFDVASVARSLSHQNVPLMHDIAEGGLATAVTELSRATGLGLTIHFEAIPWDSSIVQLCSYLGWNPLHCSSFGSFLIATNRSGASKILSELNQRNRPAAIIGEFTAKRQILLKRAGKTTPLPKGHDPYRDYTAKIM